MENHRFEIDKNHQNLRKSYAGYIKTMENQEKVFGFKIKGKKKCVALISETRPHQELRFGL